MKISDNEHSRKPIDSNSAEQLVADLFNYGAPTYPAYPGSRVGGTSRDAADKIAPFARGLRGKVAARLASIHPRGATPDEVASSLGVSPFATRPRFTELSAAGLIEKTGERRANVGSRLLATVWKAGPLLLENAPSLVPPMASGDRS